MPVLAVVQAPDSVRVTAADSASLAIGSIPVGRLLVVTSSVLNTNGTTATVSDDVNTGNYAQSATISAATNSQLFIHHKANTLLGTTTVTVNPVGASAAIDFTVLEVSGASLTLPEDKTGTSSSTFDKAVGATSTMTLAALAQADELVVGAFSHTGDSPTLTSGSGFTLAGENENNITGQCYHAEYKIVASTTGPTVDGAIGAVGIGTATWIIAAASFKEVGPTGATEVLWAGVI